MKKIMLLLLLLCFISSCSKNKEFSFEEEQLENDAKRTSPCINGFAGIFPCNGYDLLARLTLTEMGTDFANDVWGWTDPTTDKEYALIGLKNGTAFLDITDTENLIYLGKLSTATVSSFWRDIKVYNNHAFIVSEAENHGMQVFDLAKLRTSTNAPVNFTADAHYTGFGNAHNIVINENTGFAYVVGTARNDVYAGGVHFININNPKAPVAAGGYAANGYTHDAQVITYNGPDTDYIGKEIFIGANEDQVVLIDVTDKSAAQEIATITYNQTGYTHQGWFTEDHTYFILGDETDEINFGFDTRTLVFDFSDLELPTLHTTYLGETTATDHNGYVKGNQFFLANYTAGMRVLDITNIASKTLTETAYFDTFPTDNNAGTKALWSIYPYFDSGKIILNDTESGVFVIKKSE